MRKAEFSEDMGYVFTYFNMIPIKESNFLHKPWYAWNLYSEGNYPTFTPSLYEYFSHTIAAACWEPYATGC